jgi:phosphoglycolate phosphatase-like HAD superfamily hydrolase
VRKPDPGGLRTISEALGLAPRDLLLVGDSSIDRDTAAACGAAFVWAEWGYAQPAERAALAAGRRAATPRDLRRWLEPGSGAAV